MRPTGNWRPKGFLGPLIGSYLRLADKTLQFKQQYPPPVDVPGSLELTRPDRGNFDLYEDGLAPQGWILTPEGGPSEEQKRGADVSAALSCLLGPLSTPSGGCPREP